MTSENQSIKFGTDGWRGVIAADYTQANLARVCEGAASWLHAQSDKPSVMIGYDCRFGGLMFARAAANRLAQRGIRVFLSTGFVSTPMVSLATLQRQCTAGFVITASHNPPEYNGFKVKGHFGGPAFPNMIAELEALIPLSAPPLEDRLAELEREGLVEYYDMEALYINHLRQTFNFQKINEANLKLGYDPMYGAGQRAMRKLVPYAKFLHAENNPGFDGQAPEPIARNLRPFQELIRKEGLDWGLATDGDADRIGLFDETGAFVDSHHILLLLMKYLAGAKGQTGKIVCTFSCTDKIRVLAERYDLPLEITKIGFKYIGEIMAREDVLVGGEESGGIAVAGHVPERDGIYIGLMILQMMVESGKKLTELVQDLYDEIGPFAVRRNDLHLSELDKQRIMKQCREKAYAAFGPYTVEQIENIDGYKFRLGAGKWVMIRPSGTEPVLRIYAEGPDETSANSILDATIAAIQA